jgi:hypothetical protein
MRAKECNRQVGRRGGAQNPTCRSIHAVGNVHGADGEALGGQKLSHLQRLAVERP